MRLDWQILLALPSESTHILACISMAPYSSCSPRTSPSPSPPTPPSSPSLPEHQGVCAGTQPGSRLREGSVPCWRPPLSLVGLGDVRPAIVQT